MSRQILVALVTAALAAGFAACGDSDDSSTTTAATAAESQPAQPQGEAAGRAAAKPEPRPEPEGAAAEFIVKGGDNSIQEFGSEADSSELEEAAAALHGYLDARAGGNWGGACTYLAASTIEGFEQFTAGSKELQGKGCGEILGALSKGIPPTALREAAQAEAGALRVEGERAFILYHGAENTDYAMPMADEGGSWKVAALAGTPLS